MKLKTSALERRIIEIMGKHKLVPINEIIFIAYNIMRKRVQRNREEAEEAKKTTTESRLRHDPQVTRVL